jgi:hypothetical protein
LTAPFDSFFLTSVVRSSVRSDTYSLTSISIDGLVSVFTYGVTLKSRDRRLRRIKFHLLLVNRNKSKIIF